MKICVYTFGPNACCGGATALFSLARNLRTVGMDVRVWQATPGNYYNIPRVYEDCDRDWLTKDTFVVYPEPQWYLPRLTRNAIRWSLFYTPPTIATKYGWHTDDLCYAYTPSFRFSPDDPLLWAFETWPNLIYTPSLKTQRAGTCHAIKKGAHKPVIPETLGTENVYASPTVAGDAFRKYERFISYDTATWMSLQAALCGCLSIVVPDEGVTADEWRNGNQFHKYGIAYGLGEAEIKWAKSTAGLVPEYLRELERDSIYQAETLYSTLKAKA